MAGLASFHARDLKFLYGAANGIPKVDLDLIFEIAAGLLLNFEVTAATAAAEKLAEEIAEAGTTAGTGTARCTRRAAPEIEPAKIKVDIGGVTRFVSWRR